MTNEFILSSVIAKRAIPLYAISSAMVSKCDRRLDPEYNAHKGSGDTVTIRVYSRATVKEGYETELEEIKEKYQTFTLGKPLYVGTSLSGKDMVLNIKDFEDQWIKPRVQDLGKATVGKIVEQAKLFTNIVGNIEKGKLKSPTAKTFAMGRAHVINNGAPSNNINCFIGHTTNAHVIDELKNLVNPAQKVGSMVTAGYIGSGISGMDWFSETSLGSHTVGTYDSKSTVASINNASEYAHIQTKAGISGTLKRGDHITIGGVLDYNSQNLKQFVVLEDCNTGNTSIKISPSLEEGYSVHKLPKEDALISLVLPPGTTYRRNFICHKSALTLVIAKESYIPTMDMSIKTSPDFNISLTYRRGGDFVKGTAMHRLSILMTCKALLPEFGCIIADPIE